KQNKQTRPANTRHGLRPHITLKQSEKRSELQSALEIHQQGNLPEARQRYEAILLREPEHAEALHLLGVIEHQSGEHHSAVKTIERAVELKPEAVLFRKNLAS